MMRSGLDQMIFKLVRRKRRHSDWLSALKIEKKEKRWNLKSSDIVSNRIAERDEKRKWWIKNKMRDELVSLSPSRSLNDGGWGEWSNERGERSDRDEFAHFFLYRLDELHAKLVYAETLLIRALLTFIQDQGLFSFISGALKIKECHDLFA